MKRNKNILYLASSSSARYELLKSMQIDFAVIEQNAQEVNESKGRTLAQLVRDIAIEKMAHVKLPFDINIAFEGNIIFVLTADTLTQDKFGNVHGKPKDYPDAVSKINILSSKAFVSTAYCLEKKQFKLGHWVTINRIVESIDAECILDIPKNWIDVYIKNCNALNIAGGIEIEDYGLQFLKCINGSFTTIIGLPLFELRQSLEKLGFY